MASKQEIIEAIIKSNIGDVADGIDKAAKSTKDLGKQTDKLEGGLKKAEGGVKKVTVGFKTLAKASGIVFLLNKAFEIFQEVLGKNQKVMDGFKIATESLSIVFNDLFKFISNNVGNIVSWFKTIFEDPGQSIRDFGDAIVDNVIERFNSLLDTFGHVGKALKHLVKGEFGEAWDSVKDAGKEVVDVYTGVNNSVDKLVAGVTKGAAAVKEYVTATVSQATALVEAEKAANRADAEFAKLNATYLKQAEELRQVRDDTTKTFEERIQANEDLNKVLEKQQKLQREQIQKQIAYAQQQYNINASEENWIELQNAKNAALELEETITGQLSEQKTNQVALAQELLDAENELALVGKTNREKELIELEQNYQKKLDLARRAGQDIAGIEAEFATNKADINAAYNEEEAAIAQEKKDQDLADQEEQDALDAERRAAQMEAAFAVIDAVASHLQQSLDEQAEKIESQYTEETEATDAKYAEQIEIAKKAGKDTTKLEKAQKAEQEKTEKKFNAKRKAQLKKQKKLQVAMATIDTFKSATAAFSSLAGIPVVGPVLGGIAAAAAVVAGMANIRKILKQDVGDGGGGSGGSDSAATAAATTAAQPPAAEMMSGKFSLGGGEAPEPVKAFVVADEMTNKQEQLNDIRRESTL
tara:strand:- start:3600 stop:5531 length:1932 start_codon:yes stop_codon:yes gene_type:complete